MPKTTKAQLEVQFDLLTKALDRANASKARKDARIQQGWAQIDRLRADRNHWRTQAGDLEGEIDRVAMQLVEYERVLAKTLVSKLEAALR